MEEVFSKGLIQIYTGNGKGKTTAALGLTLRAVGAGLKVAIIQFLKSGKDYSELNALAKFSSMVTIDSFGRDDFIYKSNPIDEDYKLAKAAFNTARARERDRSIKIIVLDELNVALHYKLLDLNEVLNFLSNKRQDVEIVITGRYAPPELIKVAHLVTEMKEIKHPYQSGIMARKGIEY